MWVNILVHRLLVGDHGWQTNEIKGVSSDRIKLKEAGQKLRNDDPERKYSTYLLRKYDLCSGLMLSEVEIKHSSTRKS